MNTFLLANWLPETGMIVPADLCLDNGPPEWFRPWFQKVWD
jgi:hypothetical protein